MISFQKREQAQQAAAIVGVDAGKFKHVLVVRPKACPDSKPFAFETSRSGFDQAVRFIKSLVSASPAEMLVGIEFAGNYGFTFAHYLHQLGFRVVSVLPSHTKSWKDVAHNLNLKTDAKDAAGITDLAWQGHFVKFAFLQSRYAELRYLVSSRERLQIVRKGCITRLRTVLQVVFPEFEGEFRSIVDLTPLSLLEAFPGPQELLAARKSKVLSLLRRTSRNHVGAAKYERLCEAARATLALEVARGALKTEIALLIERYRVYERQLATVEATMVAALDGLPETPALLSMPLVGPISAAAFLGAVGDPQAYDSSREILRLAGLTLTERSSGIHKGEPRISKRGRPGLRAMAYMLAVRGIAKGRMFRPEYDRLMARNGGKAHKALIAIARRALRIMFSVARSRRIWTPEPPSQTCTLADGSDGVIV